MKSTHLRLIVGALFVLAGAATSAAPAYHFRLPAQGLSEARAPAEPTPVVKSSVGDGVSTAGACASGAASGCATWSVTGVPAGIIVASDLLAVQGTSMGATRGAIGKTSDKWYWEITLLAEAATAAPLIGVGTKSLSLANPFTAVPPTWSWYLNPNPGNAKVCGDWQGGSQLATAGDVVGVALDATAHSVTFYKNGSLVFTCSNVTAAEAVYPVFGAGGGSNRIKANFGQSNFQFAVPAGYNAGLW